MGDSEERTRESVCSKRAPRCENERAKHRGATMTTEANVGAEAASEELKRLGFLYDYGAMAADLSAKYYDLVKKQAPQTLSPGIETIEGAIKAYGAPIVSKVQDLGPKVITEADKRVDNVVERVNGVYESGRGVVDKYANAENIKAFKKTREEYLKQIETLLEELKNKGLQGSLTEVMAYVNGLKETAVKKGMKRVDGAKATPMYAKTYTAFAQQLTSAQETAMFKKVVSLLEEIKSKDFALVTKGVTMATPYVEKATPYVETIMESFKPPQTTA